jgi:hypothetical protein
MSMAIAASTVANPEVHRTPVKTLGATFTNRIFDDTLVPWPTSNP